MDGWIPVFKAGRHTDSQGRIRDWAEEDLDRMIASTRAAGEDIPLVIGHPKSESLSWGKVEAQLKRMGKILYAKPKGIAEAFKKIVNEGLNRVSIKAMLPDLRLRHIGFFGPDETAIKDLPAVSFEEGRDMITIEFEGAVDPAELLKQKALELTEKPYRDQRGERSLTYSEAVRIVMQENPELPRQIREAQFAEWGF